jgi:hypothetical protein
MGIDAWMAVALREGADVSAINQRFKKTHDQSDCLFKKDEELIIGLCPSYWEAIEYVNAYRVNTSLNRFYGQGYERGPCQNILLQLEWLRAQPEVIEVYYGGDCSDAPSLWTEADSVELIKHYWKHGNTPYAKWAEGSWS